MSRRPYMSRFQCSHEGCREIANYEAHTREEQRRQYDWYGGGKWKCTRHSNVEEVLSVETPRRVHEIASQALNGKNYWNRFGFQSGPGFRAWADDFPTGAVLRVTAEIVLPADQSPATGSALDGAPQRQPEPQKDVSP